MKTLRMWWRLGMAQRQVFFCWVCAIVITAFIPLFLGRGDWVHAIQCVSIAGQAWFAGRVMRWMCRRIDEDEARWNREQAADEAIRRLQAGEDLP